MTKLHFISGLPRSGSTLLAGFLRQNPRFHASMTSPVGTFSSVMLNTTRPAHAAIACNEFLDLDLVVPIHWGTFDLLHGDPEVLKRKTKRGRVHIAKPGELFGL